MTTRRLLLLAAALLLGALFFLDLNTGRELIPAITYTVPVALSSLAHAPRWTGALVALSLLATAGAGVQNTLEEGVSSAALLNRALAALSVALVGTFALLLERKGARLTQLEREEGRADREADLRHLRTDLSHEHIPHTLLSHAATSLQPLFGAAKIVIKRDRARTPERAALQQRAGQRRRAVRRSPDAVGRGAAGSGYAGRVGAFRRQAPHRRLVAPPRQNGAFGASCLS